MKLTFIYNPLIFAAILLLSSFTVFAQTSRTEKSYEFAGTLNTRDSEIIAGANLYFKQDERTSVAVTNINGEFKVSLYPGDYKITVNQELSKTFIAFIKIRENGLNPNNVDFTIQTDTDKLYPKPTKLPAAAYPAAAKAVGATGEVVVLAKIDKEGKVISAVSENGHPLLRAASEKAAKNSEFESAEITEIREVKLTYVFLNPFQENRNLRRFKNLYRIEIQSSSELIQHD